MLHGTDAAHATVAFVATSLVQHDFAWGFLRACKHATHHHRAGTCSNRLGNVAAVADATVRNQRNARAAQSRGHIVDGGDLRHAHASDNAGGANGARANANLDRIGACFGQREGRSTRGNVAADHVDLRVIAFHPTHTLNHAVAVAVGCIDDDRIHTSLDKRFDTLFSTLAHAHCRAYTQAARHITCSIGETGLLGDVFDGNQAFQLKGIVDDQDAFQLVLIQ